MENECKFDNLCKAAIHSLKTAKLFAELHNERLVAASCVQAYRNLEEADQYAEVDLAAVRGLFRDVRDSCAATDWQAARDNLSVVEGFVEAAAQAHQQQHERGSGAKSLSELQNILQLTSWEPPKGFLPN